MTLSLTFMLSWIFNFLGFLVIKQINSHVPIFVYENNGTTYPVLNPVLIWAAHA